MHSGEVLSPQPLAPICALQFVAFVHAKRVAFISSLHDPELLIGYELDPIGRTCRADQRDQIHAVVPKIMSYLLIALADARKQTCAACPCRSAEEDLGLHCHLPSSLRYRTRMSQT